MPQFKFWPPCYVAIGLSTINAADSTYGRRGVVGTIFFLRLRVVLRYTPQLFFNEIGGFKTSSRSYLLKHGVPRHPDAIDRYTFLCKITQENIWIRFFVPIYRASFPCCVEQPGNVRLKKIAVFFFFRGGTIVESLLPGFSTGGDTSIFQIQQGLSHSHE